MRPVDWHGTALTPLSGGYSGETFLVGDDPDEQVVLRIYRRDPERALVDAALLRLVRGILPVPRVIDARGPVAGEPALLVTEMLEGVPLDVLLCAQPRGVDWEQLGSDVGYVLARLSGMPFLRAGEFVGPDLQLSSDTLPGDLREFAQHRRDTARLAAWGDRDFDALLDLVDLAEEVSDDARHEDGARFVLVHSDFNAKNILVDPETSEVTGLLDWEFAHAGSPYADYGNVSRFERGEQLSGPAIEAFAELAPGVSDVEERARAADLWALVELAGRVEVNSVCALATELLLAQARSGNLHAWPWKNPRVDPKEAKRVL